MSRYTMRQGVNNAMRQRLFTEYLNEQKQKEMETIYYKENLNSSNVMKYFEEELSKTSLVKDEIEVDEKLKRLIGLTKIELILEDNDIDNDTINIDFEYGAFEFESGNNVLISKDEIEMRFNDVFEGTLEYLKTL